MKKTAAALAAALTFAAPTSRAAECPADGKCLTAEQLDAVKKAVKELDEIHRAPAVVTVEDPIVIIHDWDGRVYVNGGATRPLRMKLRIGPTVERDMAATVTARVYYRPKPPDPMFRLRIRAQASLLPLEALRTDEAGRLRFWDAGVGWDFFHLGDLNVSAYTGVYSAGGGIGWDVTRNFGPYVGYSLVYDGLRSSVAVGAYMSFN